MFLSLMEATMLLAQAASDPWADVFFGLDEEKRFVVLIIAISCGTGIILGGAGIIAGLVSSFHRRRTETAMKQDLIDRGMAADEIAQIVESSTPEDAASRFIANWGKKK